MTVSFDRNALPPLREVIAHYELRAQKSLGQNFLLDGNLTDKIARQAGDLTQYNIIEIGPGPGGLTRSLLSAGAATLTAFEKDWRCVTALRPLMELAQGRFTVQEADALEVDLLSLVPAPRKIVANLPYNIATPLLFQWLDAIYADPNSYAGLTLMFQKEVADRIAATPGGKDYGRLAVMAQWLCEVYVAFDIPPSAFTPPPKVTSSVVVLNPRSQPRAEADKQALEKVVAAAFGQRRKMLRASLKSLRPDSESWLVANGIEPTLRAEQLSIEQFCALARSL